MKTQPQPHGLRVLIKDSHSREHFNTLLIDTKDRLYLGSTTATGKVNHMQRATIKRSLQWYVSAMETSSDCPDGDFVKLCRLAADALPSKRRS